MASRPADAPRSAAARGQRPEPRALRFQGSRTTSRTAARVAVLLLLVVATVVTVLPLVWMVSTSFKAPDAVFTLPIRWLPDALRWGNYTEALTSRPFGRYAVNSIGVSLASVAITVLLSAAAGYSFARFHYPGRDLLFVLVLATIVIPFEAIALPLYLQIHRWHWLNTYLGLTLPTALSPIGIFIMRQYILGIPQDFLDSARSEGASEPRILATIIWPLSLPALAAVAIFTFVWNWNNYLWPLLVVSRDWLRTLPLGMALFENQLNVNYNQVMAVAVFGALPLVLMFILLQRNFVRGVALTGLREG